MKYTILILMRATPAWLSLSRDKRREFFEKEITPIFAKFSDSLKIRLFDSEAFHAKTSDFMIIECENLKEYYYFIEFLRDTKIFSEPYFELNEIITGVENGFQEFEKNVKMR
jgi:hypothetical protein